MSKRVHIQSEGNFSEFANGSGTFFQRVIARMKKEEKKNVQPQKLPLPKLNNRNFSQT